MNRVELFLGLLVESRVESVLGVRFWEVNISAVLMSNAEQFWQKVFELRGANQ